MTDPFTATVTVAACGVIEGADRSLSIARWLLGQLRAEPALAAVKLPGVLDEAVMTYQMVDGAITRFGSLALDEEP